MKTTIMTLAFLLAIAGMVWSDQDKGSSDSAGLVAHYFKDVANWGGNWPDDVSVPKVNPNAWTFGEYRYSRVEPVINHLFVSNGWFSVRWTGYIDPADLADNGSPSQSVLGDININPNNSINNEFTLYFADGRFITRADLTADFAGYEGVAVRVHLKPKGSGNQNGLTVNGEPYMIVNANTYDIESSLMNVRLYNAKKDDSMGQWRIWISAMDATITCSEAPRKARKSATADAKSAKSGKKDQKPGDMEYVFQIWADDGCSLMIDNKTLIDGWKACWEQTPESLRTAAPIKLSPGKHKVVIEYFQGQSLKHNDRDPMKFYWSAPSAGIARQIVPPSCFTHDANNLKSSAR